MATTARRVIIVHGWNDSPANVWIEWLASELRARDIEVVVPAMPNPRLPRLERWIDGLRRAVGELDERTVIVAYSLGTPTVLRLLNDWPKPVEIAGLVLVAGFGDGIRERPGVLFAPPLDFGLIAGRARTRVCIYSNNDRVVAPRRSKALAGLLGAREVMVVGAGHFLGSKRLPGSIARLPAALDAVMVSYETGWTHRLGRWSRKWSGRVWDAAGAVREFISQSRR